MGNEPLPVEIVESVKGEVVKEGYMKGTNDQFARVVLNKFASNRLKVEGEKKTTFNPIEKTAIVNLCYSRVVAWNVACRHILWLFLYLLWKGVRWKARADV